MKSAIEDLDIITITTTMCWNRQNSAFRLLSWFQQCPLQNASEEGNTKQMGLFIQSSIIEHQRMPHQNALGSVLSDILSQIAANSGCFGARCNLAPYIMHFTFSYTIGFSIAEQVSGLSDQVFYHQQWPLLADSEEERHKNLHNIMQYSTTEENGNCFLNQLVITLCPETIDSTCNFYPSNCRCCSYL